MNREAVVSLREIADLNPRLQASIPANARVAFVPMSAISPEDARANVAETRPYSEVSKGYSPFLSGDLLVAKITPCFENGKIAQIRFDEPFGFGSTEFHVVRPHSDRVDARYLLHYLRQERVRRIGEGRMTGSAGQRRVPAHFLSTLRVPLPVLSEQRRIATILDGVEALRAKRRATLTLFESLTSAAFLEMFGDPALNPRCFPLRPIGELAEKFSDGPFGSNLKSSHYVESGVRVVRLQNIGIGRFNDSDRAFVSEAHYARLRKHDCRPGDVLVATLGDPNLRACVQPDWLPVALNKADCVQIRPNRRLANAAYVAALLNQPSTERMAHALVVGQTRLRISMGRLRTLVVPVPPLPLQDEFAAQIRVIEELTEAAVRSAAALDSLFASLQHQAFNGELQSNAASS